MTAPDPQLDLITPRRSWGLQVYASRTGTRRALSLFRRWGWRILVSARGVLRTEGFAYAIDNGAWTSYARGEPFDAAAFRRAVDTLGADADWVVLPDVVGDRDATLRLSSEWAPALEGHRRMLVLQDGVAGADVDVFRALHPLHGVFVGGSSGWKDANIAWWSAWARERGLVCHVGRVNTRARLRLCVEARVHSVDGSGVSRFIDHAVAFRGWCVDLGVS